MQTQMNSQKRQSIMWQYMTSLDQLLNIAVNANSEVCNDNEQISSAKMVVVELRKLLDDALRMGVISKQESDAMILSVNIEKDKLGIN